MKEIKFRVWSIKYNQWMNHCAVIDCLGDIGSHFIAKHDNGKIEERLVALPKEENVIQQFTGLKDSKGAEIYEGDIIFTANDTLRTVVWSESECRFVAKIDDKDNYPFSVSSWLTKNYPNLEVKGNIFENPGLLK